MKSKELKDEFTTEMHADMLSCEMSREDVMVMGVYGAMRRGYTKEEALAKYGLTEEFYDKNVRRVIYNE